MPETLLTIQDVSKSFPGVKALDNISLEIFRGEVHAIVGENGAGKSTLMHILSGVYSRDQGVIIFDGKELNIADPKISQQLGISTVYQELALSPNLSVMDNVFLWNLPKNHLGFINRAKLYKQTKELLDPFEVDLNPATLVRDLSVSQQQLVEIAKALSRNASLIILDEPNSALSPTETAFLFTIIKRLSKRGVTVLFISHRLDEVFEIADRITILRDGRLIEILEKSNTTIEHVVSSMVGRELGEAIHHQEEHHSSDKVVLSVNNLSSGRDFKNISFDLHEGEILGIFGLVGAGRTQLAETILGTRHIDDGTITAFGHEFHAHTPTDIINLGIGFVPEDRKNAGLFLKMAVADNINISSFNQLSKFGWIDARKEQTQAQRMVQDLNIRLSSPRQVISSLSGGNQQKSILGRWLALNPKILILDEPTRGIDVGAKAQIYELINRFANSGVAVLLISSEIEEVIALADRLMVMRRGVVSNEFGRKKPDRNKIMFYAA